MKTLFIVCTASASQDDHCNSHAYADVYGVYTSKESALKGLVACKDELYDDITKDSEFCEADSVQVYGSEENEYFEIDYTFCDCACEIHISIVEKELND